MDYDEILKRSLKLSKPFWDFYDQLIGNRQAKSDEDEECSGQMSDASDDRCSSDQNDNDLHPEYLEFIRITRAHQAKREKEKRIRQKKGLDVETYYKDISQVDTLVEDNLVDVPDRHGKCDISKRKEQKLIELYGGREAYETVRSMEMTIDEFFHRKRQQLKPGYWPVMPINYRRYLNSVEK